VKLARSFLSLVPARAKRTEHDRVVEHSVAGHVRLRAWLDGPHPEYAIQLDREGRMHGRERHWSQRGRLTYDAGWIHGTQHGLQRQWDAEGHLIVRTRFVRGTGLDVWCGFRNRLSETREMKAGHRHGYERHWTGARRVHREEHFHEGLEHGVLREWDADGVLKRRAFFVRGTRVDRRAYERAAKMDPTLPPFDLAADRPARRAPPRVASD